jgi:hypothetical protein
MEQKMVHSRERVVDKKSWLVSKREGEVRFLHWRKLRGQKCVCATHILHGERKRGILGLYMKSIKGEVCGSIKKGCI